MTAKLSPRHRGSEKALTPLADISDSFGVFGKRSVAVASATGIALTAVVASTATATAPTALPQAPQGDFVSNLEATDAATLVSLDVEWDPGDTVSVKAEEPAPEPEPEPEPEPVVQQNTTASRSEERYVEPVTYSAPPATMGSVVDTALQYVGSPYVWGASGPNAFDCSGFTSYIYGLHGISLPHSSGAQGGYGTPISAAEAQPGDLVVWTNLGHVGIYLGGGQIVHAGTPATGVNVSGLFGSYYFVRL